MKKMRKNILKIFLCLSIVVFSFSLINCKAQTPASLYDRLGGVYGISAVVDEFIDKLVSDSVITANQNVVAAMQRINKPGLKYLVTEMVCQASGGPQKYSGRSMKDSHAALNISELEWAQSVKIFVEVLDKFKVPEKEKNELLAIVSSTKADIVTATAKPQEAPAPAKILEPPPPKAEEKPTNILKKQVDQAINEILAPQPEIKIEPIPPKDPKTVPDVAPVVPPQPSGKNLGGG